MTSEELVAKIQAGDQEALLTLWHQVRRLAWWFIRRWRSACRRSGMEDEDLEQMAFLALIKAVSTFDSEAGTKFSSWFSLSVRKELSATVGRTERQQQEPLRTAVSLDAPASEDVSEGDTLGALIEDPAAEVSFEESELRIAVEEVLVELPEKQRKAVRDRFWYDCPSYDRIALAAALRLLRHPSRSQRLKGLL